MLCLGCQVKLSGPCDHCGGSVAGSAPEQRFDFFDGPVGPGTWTSNAIARQGNNLVIEAFPVGSGGSATAAVLDAPAGGSLTTAADPAAAGPPLTAYKKWMVRGLLPHVALKVSIASGVWAFAGAFTNEVASNRGDYYDRNATTHTQFQATGAIAPPASPTQLWTYVVPSNRRASLELVFAYAQRASAASVSNASVLVDYTPVVSGLVTRILQVFLTDNAQNAALIGQVTNFGFMAPGDTISATYLDTSTGGSVVYVASAKYTEFDA